MCITLSGEDPPYLAMYALQTSQKSASFHEAAKGIFQHRLLHLSAAKHNSTGAQWVLVDLVAFEPDLGWPGQRWPRSARSQPGGEICFAGRSRPKIKHLETY